MTKNVWSMNGASELMLDDTDISPSGAWNIPYGYTEVQPPKEKEGYTMLFTNNKWTYIEVPVEESVSPEDSIPNSNDEVTEVTEVSKEAITIDNVNLLMILADQEERLIALEEKEGR